MWTNLFELLDGLFRGIIYFFYNFVETAYRVIRRPTTGPLFLFRKHRNPAQRQIGGLTFLFLSFFGLFSFWLLFLEEADSRNLGMTISELPSLEAKSLWPTVAGAILSTVAIDAPIRLFLWWRLSRNRLRRDIILGSIHYAIFVPVFAGLGGSILALRIVEADWFPWRSTTILTSLLIVPFLLMAWLVRPAVALLGKASARGAGMPRDAPGRRPIYPLLMPILLYGAIIAGWAAAITLESERQAQADAERHLRLLAIRCDLRDGILTVSAVVWNPWREPKVLELGKDIETAIGQFRRKASFETLSGASIHSMTWLEPKDDFQIVDPGKTLRLRGTSETGLFVQSDDRCGLTRGRNSSESIVGATWPIGTPPIDPREGIRQPPPPNNAP